MARRGRRYWNRPYNATTPLCGHRPRDQKRAEEEKHVDGVPARLGGRETNVTWFRSVAFFVLVVALAPRNHALSEPSYAAKIIPLLPHSRLTRSVVAKQPKSPRKPMQLDDSQIPGQVCYISTGLHVGAVLESKSVDPG